MSGELREVEDCTGVVDVWGVSGARRVAWGSEGGAGVKGAENNG